MEDQLRKAQEKLVRVLGEQRDGERVDSKLSFVGGEVEAQPWSFSHWKGLVELGGQSVEVWCKGGSGGGRVGDEEGDGAMIINLGRDCERENTVCISEDTGGDVGEGGGDEGRLWMLRGGGTGSIKPSFGCGERLWCLGNRQRVAG